MIEISSHSDVICLKGSTNYQNITMNIYVFLVDHMLVDTGPVSLLEEFTSYYKEADIDLVALTHHHEDHTGCAKWLSDNKNVPIYINEKSIEVRQSKSEYPKFRQEFWGIREGFLAKPLGKKVNSRNQLWEVIETPGHAEDHVVFLNHHTGVLFSGDLFVSRKVKAVLPGESIPELIRSIRKILTYDFKEMFCSHSGYLKDGRQLLQSKLEFLENLQGEVLELNKKGFSLAEIDAKLFSNPPALAKISDDGWTSANLIHSIIT